MHDRPRCLLYLQNFSFSLIKSLINYLFWLKSIIWHNCGGNTLGFSCFSSLHSLPTFYSHAYFPGTHHEAVVLHVLSSSLRYFILLMCFVLFFCVCVFVYTVSNLSFRAFLACLQSYIRCWAAAPSPDPLPPNPLTPRPSLTPLHSKGEKPTTSLPLPTQSTQSMTGIGAGEGEESVTGRSCSTVTPSEHVDTRELLRRHSALLHCCVNRNESSN